MMSQPSLPYRTLTYHECGSDGDALEPAEGRAQVGARRAAVGDVRLRLRQHAGGQAVQRR